MSPQKKRWCALRSIMLSLVTIIMLAGPVAAQAPHWAQESVEALAGLNIGSDELGPAVAGVTGARLDEPISPLEWQTWVRQALAVEKGTDWINDKDMSFWVDTYTIPEHEGPRSVLSRGYAVAGLMKMGNLVGFIPGSGQGTLVYLPRFSDWRKVEELGFSGPWELMLAAGIVSGYPDGTLRPEAPLTRAEAACLLKAWWDVYRSAPVPN